MAETKRTTTEEQKIAQTFLAKLQGNTKKTIGKGNSIGIKIQGKEDDLRIPAKAFTMLFNIVSSMAEGKSMTLLSSDAEITTQQAAEMLNVSRPHLVKLLEEGAIPFKKAGTHRRILLADVVAYQNKLKANRKEKLDFLANQAQELNLGY